MSPLTRLVAQPSPVAYFSMEVGLDPAMPTYAGGLGVLAGDTLRAAADLGIPMVGVTLLYRKGYFHQHLDDQDNQSESPAEWSPRDYLEPLPQRAMVEIEGWHVQLRPWLYKVRGVTGHDKFRIDLVRQILGAQRTAGLAAAGCFLVTWLVLSPLE